MSNRGNIVGNRLYVNLLPVLALLVLFSAVALNAQATNQTSNQTQAPIISNVSINQTALTTTVLTNSSLNQTTTTFNSTLNQTALTTTALIANPAAAPTTILPLSISEPYAVINGTEVQSANITTIFTLVINDSGASGGVAPYSYTWLESFNNASLAPAVDCGPGNALSAGKVTPCTFAITSATPAGSYVFKIAATDSSGDYIIDGQGGGFQVCVKCDGTINVFKNVVGSSGLNEFNFTITGTHSTQSNFNITTVGSSNSKGLGSSFKEGTYQIVEHVPKGWTLTKATCSCTDGTIETPSKIIINNDGPTVTCTFNNTKNATLTVIKHVNNNFGGTLTASNFNLHVTNKTGDVHNSPAAGSETGVVYNLTPGNYTVSENAVLGYNGVVSGDCSTSGKIKLGAGVNKTCTITNNDIQPRLIVTKIVNNKYGGTATSATFTMSVTGTNVTPASFPGNSAGTTVKLNAGPYSVGESTLQGYGEVSAIGCSGTMSVGQTQTCTITNNDMPANLIIVKNTVGGDGKFNFTLSTAIPAIHFSITTSGNTGNVIFSGNVLPGIHSVTENTPYGWTQTSAVCFSSNGQTMLPSSITATAGQTITCTFTDTKNATITIVKKTVGGDGTFSFTSTGGTPPGSFSIATTSGTGTQSFTNNVIPGTYSLSELVPAGWVQMSAVCNGANTTSSITAVAGKTVTCTFNDTKNATINVVKDTRGSDGTFNFTFDDHTFQIITTNNTGSFNFTQNVAPGGHNLTESTPNGWVLQSKICNFESGGFNLAVVPLTVFPGEILTCTFTDNQNSTINVIKNTKGGDGTFNFTLDDKPFSITTSGHTGETSFTQNVLPTGTHSILEQTPYGWTLTSATCNYEKSPDDFSISPSQTVTCTFNDTQNATLTVIKTVNNCAPCTGGTATANQFTMNVIYSGGSKQFPGNELGTTVSITSGAFQVTETAQNGYVAAYHGSCFGTALPGQALTCNVINNAVNPTLTVIKNVLSGTALPGEFTLNVTNNLYPSPFPGSSTGTLLDVKPGPYNVVEIAGPPGYMAHYSTGCSGTMVLGANAICVVNNTFEYATITVIKNVFNNYTYGTLTPNSFAINVISNGVVVASFNGSSTGTTVKLLPGPFQVVEVNPSGYLVKYTGVCYGTATFGQNIVCTISDCDQPGFLKVIKTVIGGTALPSDFTINVTNSAHPSPFPGNSVISLIELAPGPYQVTELAGGPSDYTPTYSPGCSGTIAMGQNVTCTVNNNYDYAPLGSDVSLSNSTITVGQPTLITTNVTGGVPPYSFEFKIISSATSTTIVDDSLTQNSMVFKGTTASVGNDKVEVFVTDSSYGHEILGPISLTVTSAATSSSGASSGGSSSSGGPGGGGGGSSQLPTVLSQGQDCYSISNFTEKDAVTLPSIDGIIFHVVENFITPTSAGITINNQSMTLVPNATTEFITGDTASLTNISYIPILHTISVLICPTASHHGGSPVQHNTTTTTVKTTVPTTVPTTIPTTTVAPTTTVVVVQHESASAVSGQSGSSGLGMPLPMAGALIAIAIAVAVGVAYSRRGNGNGKKGKKRGR